MIWGILFLLLVIITILGFFYLAKRITRFTIMQKIASKRKSLCLASCIVVLLFVILFFMFGTWNAMICMIHLLLCWIICEGIAGIIHYLSNAKSQELSSIKYISKKSPYYAGILAILLTILYLGDGYFYAHHVFRTEYDITTPKKLSQDTIKVVGFSDSHVGTTFHWQKFEEYIEDINEEHADVVVIVGDFVDDDTSKEDMEKCCEALRKLQTTYGVYYVFGNHDRGYYAEARRGYGERELVENLEKNGVIVLADETVPVVDNFYLCGRHDTQTTYRRTIADLASTWSPGNYYLVLDHEPNDYSNESIARCDLVLSGHTHGGQMLPINHVGEWLGMNDFTYGHTKIDQTDFIVSSGISDWAIKFKTGCIAEYFVVNIKQE